MMKSELEDKRIRNSDDLCKLLEDLGYDKGTRQLQCNNGAYVSTLLEFLNDSPGALDTIKDFLLENAKFDEEEEEIEFDEEAVRCSQEYKDAVIAVFASYPHSTKIPTKTLAVYVLQRLLVTPEDYRQLEAEVMYHLDFAKEDDGYLQGQDDEDQHLALKTS